MRTLTRSDQQGGRLEGRLDGAEPEMRQCEGEGGGGCAPRPVGGYGGYGGGEAVDCGEKDMMLVGRIRDGDSGALSELWGRYAGLLYSQALRILNNGAEADDIVVEVFEEVWARAMGYHAERAKPVAWLLMLTRRRAIDRLRERQSYQRAGERLQKEWGVIHGGGGNQVEEQLRLGDLRRILDCALARLPEEQRRTVWMAYYQGMSQKEISERTSTSVGTVKSRMELGLKKMRDGLRENREWIAGKWEGEFSGDFDRDRSDGDLFKRSGGLGAFRNSLG